MFLNWMSRPCSSNGIRVVVYRLLNPLSFVALKLGRPRGGPSRTGAKGRSREISLPNRENLSGESETLTKEPERDAVLTVTDERQRE